VNYSSDHIKDGKGEVRTTHGDMRNKYKILVRKPEGKRPLRIPGCRWEDNIKMNELLGFSREATHTYRPTA
jgi:hypothetical protein